MNFEVCTRQPRPAGAGFRPQAGAGFRPQAAAASPRADRPLVLIVVPTLNEAPNIERIIKELLDPDGGPEVMLVVVDGGSRDGTVGIVRRLATVDRRIRYLPNPLRIQSAAINLAVERLGADVDWIVRADAHAYYPPRYIETLVAEAERTDATSVVVSMETRAEGCFQRGVAAAVNSRLGNGGAPHRNVARGRWVDHGHHALMRGEALRAAGGYDQTFTHNEDAELDVRLRANGGRIWLTGRTTIGYCPRRTASALFRQYLGYGRGRAATLLKHRIKPHVRQVLPLCVVPAVVMAMAGAVASGLGAAPWIAVAGLLPVALWSASCCGYGVALALRRRCACTLWAGPAAMIIHLAWSTGFFHGLGRRRHWRSR